MGKIFKIMHPSGGWIFRKLLMSSYAGKCYKLSTAVNPLQLKTVEDLSSFITREDTSNILVMTGAGISTPSGIPDFRSPGTGLYHNLQKYNLPYPEAIFDIDYFMMDCRPFMALAQDLYPGVNYHPNAVHFWLQLLHEEKKLQRVYTQNIDGLHSLSGLPADKLVEAHGTFTSASCTLCGKKHDVELVKTLILSGSEFIICAADNCNGKVKPDIVFFGENLPLDFWKYRQDVKSCPLLIIIGTSLEVYPFANIARDISAETQRVLINNCLAGDIGERKKDFALIGDVVDIIWQLTDALGWRQKLKNLVDMGKM